MSPRPNTIDPDKLRAAVRTLGNERVLDMLDDAIDLVPPARLRALVKAYLDPDTLRPDGKKPGKQLADVQAFEKASLDGDYYESFNVNSRNYTEQSRGTRTWIAECRRLLDRCVARAKTGAPTEVRQAFDVIFGLLDRIDDGEDIIFFADEAGAWQVGVDWEKVLPPWFAVLSATAEPDEYAQRIVTLLNHHYDYGSAKMLKAARRVATPAQRQALSRVAAATTKSAR